MNRRGFLSSLAAATFAVALDVLPSFGFAERTEIQMAVAPVEISSFFSISEALKRSYTPKAFREGELAFVPSFDDMKDLRLYQFGIKRLDSSLR